MVPQDSIPGVESFTLAVQWHPEAGTDLRVMRALLEAIDEAIAISNGTAYGLSSAVCTNRLDYVTRFPDDEDAPWAKEQADTLAAKLAAAGGTKPGA